MGKYGDFSEAEYGEEEMSEEPEDEAEEGAPTKRAKKD
jgi:hypothetical protein